LIGVLFDYGHGWKMVHQLSPRVLGTRFLNQWRSAIFRYLKAAWRRFKASSSHALCTPLKLGIGIAWAGSNVGIPTEIIFYFSEKLSLKPVAFEGTPEHDSRQLDLKISQAFKKLLEFVSFWCVRLRIFSWYMRKMMPLGTKRRINVTLDLLPAPRRKKKHELPTTTPWGSPAASTRMDPTGTTTWGPDNPR